MRFLPIDTGEYNEDDHLCLCRICIVIASFRYRGVLEIELSVHYLLLAGSEEAGLKSLVTTRALELGIDVSFLPSCTYRILRE